MGTMNNDVALQNFPDQIAAVETEYFASVLMPIGQNPSVDGHSIQEMGVFCGKMGVSVNKRGVAMFAQEGVSRDTVEVHQLGILATDFFFF